MPPNKVGRKPIFEVTTDILSKIELMSSLGVSQDHIADYFGMSRAGWFKKKLKNQDIIDAYNKGRAHGITHVTRKLRTLIDNGNVSATIFFLKTQAGWHEHSTSKVEIDDLSKTKNNDKKHISINVTDPIEAAKIYQQLMLGDKNE